MRGLGKVLDANDVDVVFAGRDHRHLPLRARRDWKDVVVQYDNLKPSFTLLNTVKVVCPARETEDFETVDVAPAIASPAAIQRVRP